MQNLNITAFCCHNALFPANMENQPRPAVAGVNVLEVPCSGKVDAIYILKAFEKGADGVMVVACEPEECVTIEGCRRLGKRVQKAKRLLAEAGLEPERIALYNVKSPVIKELGKMVNEFAKEISKLGPSPAR